MKVFVQDDKCIGCGSCVSLTEEQIFDFNEDGKAYAKVEEIQPEQESIVESAIEYCPTSAISKQEDNPSNK